MSRVDYAHTEDATDARFVKASTLAAALRKAGYTFLATARFGEGERRVAERMAGVARCSDETWAAARKMLPRRGEQ